jgi:phosphoglycolate phosphatase
VIPVDAIIFDLDGTLVDSRRDLASSVQHLQKSYGARTSTEAEVAGFVGDGVVKLVERALPGLPAGKRDAAVTAFKMFYRKHCLDHTHPYPGVRETLRYFRRKKMAVVTNKPVRVSGYMLDHLKLSPYFNVLIGGDSLPNKKPHPEPVRNALKTMGILDMKRALVVGDGPNDVLSAKAAGVRSCGIKSNIGDPQKLLKSKPDYLITHMKELMRLFS